ncbi:hypothetical protein Dthio_PD3620 [Desulfonatronospira thiodismutans ASO3-1]|uniref:Uncharacterized protein n=1 Tax=Desulfonatronospira thiodismutans ASO3-1 TaxID=555779 RepID=D6SJW1_9BACT|nr:hypothetical protein [Desulfonatronospira thiodismutans]EFI36164.1 hypothetical protein Dthio_PD3620 [Desulfonatronospira thiodismutans ASO3-1]
MDTILFRDKRVAAVDFDDPESVIVCLQNGWCVFEPGLHIFGEDSIAQAVQTLQDFVQPCNCPDCRQGLVKW